MLGEPHIFAGLGLCSVVTSGALTFNSTASCRSALRRPIIDGRWPMSATRSGPQELPC
jgi:hypothetical protein